MSCKPEIDREDSPDDEDFKLFCEIMDEAEAIEEPFREFVKKCPHYSLSPWGCDNGPPYDYAKFGRPYNRCLKTKGYCDRQRCPDYKAPLTNPNKQIQKQKDS
jgi:hypothetical protein